MNWSSLVDRVLGRKKETRPLRPQMDKHRREIEDGMTARRFLGASTHRGNWSHWRYSSAENINHALLSDLPTLIQRCSFEYANNPLVAGAVETLSHDLVGRNGPRLQVESDSEQFNDAVEAAWRTVWNMPDPNGQVCGPESMRSWIRSLCTAGAFLNVYANVKRQGPVKFGWRTIDMRRKETPPEFAANDSVAFGTRFDADGKPLKYFIRKRKITPLTIVTSADYQEVPADVVQHRYEFIEPEQIAGVPWLASCLDTVANLADYDQFEMDAAKLQSRLSGILQAAHPELVVDAVSMEAGETLPMQQGELTAIPAGWQAYFPSATHPHANYSTFRHERLRDLGLALGMPLMMILLSSADSNFSSAHYDGAVYMRRLKARQAWLERTTLNQFLEQIILELVLEGVAERPADYRFRWTWELPPYVDPGKQRKADRMALEDGALPLSEYCASLGFDFDDVVASRAREIAILQAAGLPEPPINAGNNQLPLVEGKTSDDEADDDQDEPEEADSATAETT